MEVPWSWVKPTFREIRFPDSGTPNDWLPWYESTWKRLAEHGLAEAENILDLAKIRLRALALFWITWDFSAAAEHDDYWEFEWEACRKELEIPLEALAIVVAGHGEARSIESDLDDYRQWEGTDEGDINDEVDSERSLKAIFESSGSAYRAMLMARATAICRREVLAGLEKAFGCLERFCVELFILLRLDDAIERVAMQVQDEYNEVLNRLDEIQSPTLRDELNARLAQLTSELKPGIVRAAALDRIETEIDWCDDDFCYHAMAWVMEGCPIVLRGTPEFG